MPKSSGLQLRTVGCETYAMENKDFLTGIERVVVETHIGLTELGPLGGIDFRRIHSAGLPASQAFHAHEGLASDPVLSSPLVDLDEVSAVLVLDLTPSISWRAILEQRAQRHCPVIFMIHDVLPLTNPEWFAGDAGSKRNFRVYAQQGLHVADVVIVSSEKVKQDLLGLGWKIPGKICVVPLGTIHTPRSPSTGVGDVVSLLYVTTLAPRKGHSRLLDAFDLLRSQGVDINLTLVGRPGWDSEDLFRRIRQHPDFAGRLKWFPSASDQQVVSHAAKSNVAIIPADDEGFGMFLEEALSLGLKVVASDIPVFRERMQKNVFLAESNAESLARAVLTASSTPWSTMERTEIRTMKAFASEVYDLICSELDTPAQ